MIWGNVKYIDHYKGISHALDVALDYLAAGDLKNWRTESWIWKQVYL